eukprot:XP_024446874.1 protein NRT1/ PTR FAMILY 5.10 isoform X2 [Populus trichocarpa]
MTISHLSNISSGTERSSAATPLIEAGDDSVNGSVDYKGNPVHRSTSGGWRSASFIIVLVCVCSCGSCREVCIFWDIFEPYNVLDGSSWSVHGQCRRQCEYVVWHGHFAASFRSLCCRLFSWPLPDYYCRFSHLHLAFGQGGHKPCALAFGADQFDGQNPKESKAKSSFFNWWYFYSSVGVNLTLVVMVYIQDNLSWALGFGIPCIVMTTTLLILLLGSRTYRYSVNGNEKNPFMRIGRVIHRAIRNRHTTPPSAMPGEEDACQWHQSHEQFKFLNKALLAPDGSLVDQNVCSVSDVEDTKALLKLVPIWITSLAYATVFAQTTTFFTKQGATLDRTIVSGFKIPAASLQIFIGFAIILFIPVYDRIVVPISRGLTRKPSGITMLQRIGTGMVFSAISMVTAALVEMKRLETAKEHGLVDLPNVTVPMSIWWLVPQYILCGIADVLTIVGLQEFCYDQVPKELRSLGISLYLSILGVGNFLSSFLVSVIDEATSGDGQESWFASNLNRAHLDYFYWLLAGLSAVGFIAYLYFARSYIYSRGNTI